MEAKANMAGLRRWSLDAITLPIQRVIQNAFIGDLWSPEKSLDSRAGCIISGEPASRSAPGLWSGPFLS